MSNQPAYGFFQEEDGTFSIMENHVIITTGLKTAMEAAEKIEEYREKEMENPDC